MRVGEIINRNDLIVGEVAGVEGDIIEVFVYPDKYNDLYTGSILLINSSDLKLLGLVVKKAHSSRYGTFTPLRKSREELLKAYPDIDRYHRYVSSVLYTSVIEGEQIIHVRRGLPRLHDMVYLLNRKEYILEFLRPSNKWDFKFLNYLVGANLSIFTIQEILGNMITQLSLDEDEKSDLIGELIETSWVLGKNFSIFLVNFLEELLGVR